MEKSEGKRPIRRPIRTWENIKKDLMEVCCDPGDWIDLAEDRDLWRAYVRAVMNLGLLKSQLVNNNNNNNNTNNSNNGRFLGAGD